MKKVNVLFLDLSNTDLNFQQNREDTVHHIRSIDSIHLEEESSLTNAKEKLVRCDDIKWDVFVVWVENNNSDVCNDLVNFKDEHQALDFLGIIVVFGFEENIKQKACDAMLAGIYAFAYPFNSYILLAYIESIGLEMKISRSLFQLKQDLHEAKSFDEMLSFAVLELETNPIVGYNRATISLVDNQTSERYLLRYCHHPSDRNPVSNLNPDRQLLKKINKDKLINNVNRKGVLIIDDLDYLRSNDSKKLEELGWVNTDATNDVNSWVGFSAKRQNKTVAIITLDHKAPGYYSRYSDKLVRFVNGFSEIVANDIVGFLVKRNARVIREITCDIGNNLKSDDLMRQILLKLKDELNCDNCTYFKVVFPIHINEIFLEEWISANNDTVEEQSPRIKRSFKKGMGIVGAVLTDGKSRIVPHALESAEFAPTFDLPGMNLSMLAVPVIPYLAKDESQHNRIIGVISCFKASKDHFTIYDRDLVEAISRSTATVIERTMTLEYSNDISSKMNDLLLNKDKTNLLRKICEHALEVTSARAAVIHRLEYSKILSNEDEDKYRLTGELYAFPEGVDRPHPRLDGQGTTDIVIREKKTIEFSERSKNLDYISQELLELGIKCQIVVPLMINSEVGKQQIIGALYLNKYSDVPFSEVEKFALELFASQAASTIYHQEFLSERITWTKANTDLAKAIEAIATRNDPSLILKDIASYAYSLVGASFSYLALCDDEGNFEYKAAWPEYILSELNSFYEITDNKEKIKTKGITSLAAKEKRTILISDLQKEKNENSVYWQQYIEFREGTHSELVVPIIVKEESVDKVIGVINLEHEKPYAFTDIHKEIIEHFARQVAIAFQKKSLIESVNNKN
ncbi:GAF domain-containing protein, partial [Chamaesiphon polymorphus]